MAGTEGMIKDAVDSAIVDLSTITNLELGLTYKELIDIINKNYAVIDDAIDTAIDGLLDLNSAMQFKGVIESNSELPQNNYVAGWTYMVDTAGTYAGKTCEVGDLIVCVDDYGTKFLNSDWKVIQANIDGAVTSSGNLTSGQIVVASGNRQIKTGGSYIAGTFDTNDPTNAIPTVKAVTDKLDTLTQDDIDDGTTYKRVKSGGDITFNTDGTVKVVSVGGKTADQIGRVKDVQVNGESKLNTTTGIVDIDIDSLASEYTSVTASVTKAIDGTTYYGFNVVETDTAFEVYKKLQSADTDMQQIVTHRVRKADGNIFVACATSETTVYIRKLVGGMIGGAGNAPVVLLTPIVTLESYDDGGSGYSEYGSSVSITNPNPFAVTYHLCIKNITYAISNPTSSDAYYFKTGTLQANEWRSMVFSNGNFSWTDLHNAKVYLTHESGFQSQVVDKSIQDE